MDAIFGCAGAEAVKRENHLRERVLDSSKRCKLAIVNGVVEHGFRHLEIDPLVMPACNEVHFRFLGGPHPYIVSAP